MKEKITNLLEKTSDINDDELNSHFLNYICVLISGYLEIELDKIIKEYRKSNHCNSHECKDTIQSMGKIHNAKWCAMRPVFMNIDDKILNELRGTTQDFGLTIASIDNIVKTRHKVAHGKDVTNLTREILSADLNNINSFVNKLQEIFRKL